jgi:hypothetical protein
VPAVDHSNWQSLKSEVCWLRADLDTANVRLSLCQRSVDNCTYFMEEMVHGMKMLVDNLTPILAWHNCGDRWLDDW